jgi:isoquinoline 1-oxidoreductase beta subunit
VQWTREDDMAGGRYRPMYYHKLAGGLDASGRLIAWQQRIVGQSIAAGTPFEPMLVKDSVDKTSVEGAATLPYAVPNLLVDLVTTKSQVPVLWWRSVGSTHTAYSTEVFIDELASAAGRDPVEFRRELLQGHPRHLGVLNLVADKAGWGTPPPAGRFRGIAVHESFKTYVAQVAEISLTDDGGIKVERVVCAVDCGIAVNPDIVRAQMEGGIGFGLGAILKSAITLEGGQVQETNFDTYQMLTIAEMPKVEVHIVPSTEAPTGVGEPGVPPIGPALANAVFAATGKRVRVLPFSRHEFGTA